MGVTKTTARDRIEAMETITVRALRDHGTVRMPGIASITIVETPERPLRVVPNLKGGRDLVIPARPAGRRIRVRALKTLRSKVGAHG